MSWVGAMSVSRRSHAAIPVDAIRVSFNIQLACFHQVVQVCDRFPGRHDQVAVRDLALEQGRERVEGAARFPAQLE